MLGYQGLFAISRGLLGALILMSCGRVGYDSVADQPSDAGSDASPAIDSAPTDAGLPRFGRFVATGSDDISDIAVHPSGDIYITGPFRTELSLGGDTLISAGERDIFVARFADDGSHRWSARFGGPASDEGVEIAVGPDGGFVVVGAFEDTVDFGGGPLTAIGEHDMFIASFDIAGNHRCPGGQRCVPRAYRESVTRAYLSSGSQDDLSMANAWPLPS